MFGTTDCKGFPINGDNNNSSQTHHRHNQILRSIPLLTLLNPAPSFLFPRRGISYSPIRSAASEHGGEFVKRAPARLSQVHKLLNEAEKRASGADAGTPTKITLAHVNVSFARSGCPGGQNVNKVNTKVDMRFNVKKANRPSEIAGENYAIGETLKMSCQSYRLLLMRLHMCLSLQKSRRKKSPSCKDLALLKVEFGNPTPQLGCQQIPLMNLDPPQIRLRMIFGTRFYALTANPARPTANPAAHDLWNTILCFWNPKVRSLKHACERIQDPIFWNMPVADCMWLHLLTARDSVDVDTKLKRRGEECCNIGAEAAGEQESAIKQKGIQKKP
ncbi:hypothetical protein AKJ16_DCAP01674 [Drosera capensis]